MKLKIIDNFLEKKDLITLRELKLETLNNNEIKVYHNKIFKNGTIQSECLSEEQVKNFQNKYHNKAIDILKELNPLKIDLYEYSEFHIIETGSYYKFPIHDDTPDKLLSGVIYLNPEKNLGTMFYDDKNGNGKKVVDWKVNKAVFFSRIEGQSWHSYEGDRISNRIVLVYNLMTTQIKEVYKIEKKNYFLGKFRFWINPYLYRFFKITL